MQCGRIRHTAKQAETAPSVMKVIPQYLEAPRIPSDASIQEVFRTLVHNDIRNQITRNYHACGISDFVATARWDMRLKQLKEKLVVHKVVCIGHKYAPTSSSVTGIPICHTSLCHVFQVLGIAVQIIEGVGI